MLHELFATAGDICVSESELKLTLAPLRSCEGVLLAGTRGAVVPVYGKA